MMHCNNNYISTYKTFRWIKLENAPVEIEVILLLLAFLQLKWKSHVL